MKDIFEAKQLLRKAMASQKEEYLQTTLSDLSSRAIQRIEQFPGFRCADSLAIYHALPDEVQTASFIEKWADRKAIFLPVISGDDILLCQYRKDSVLKPGTFGILEPLPDVRNKKPKPDIIIIPGIAFDRNMNRMGRGKGYYDRLLIEDELKDTLRVGLCFNFQLVEDVPSSEDDIRMHCIITDEEIITGKKD